MDLQVELLPMLHVQGPLHPDCNWKDRGKNCLCSIFPHQWSQGLKVSLDCPWTVCCNLIANHMAEN